MPNEMTVDIHERQVDGCIRDCLARGEYAGAAAAVARALALTPGDRGLLTDRAYYLLWSGDAEGARQSFADALHVDPFFAPARLGLAAAHLASGALVEAMDAARRATVADPTSGTPNATGAIVGAHGSEAVARFYAAATAAFADVQPPPLTPEHLQHSRVVPSREHILPLMPKGGTCAEVGTQTGYFAKLIAEHLQPRALHLYDISFDAFDHDHFRSLISSGLVTLHEGDSSTLLAHAPDESFDFIYVDGDHCYQGVSQDLEQARRKIRRDGWIVCNDYTPYSPLEGVKYGVYRAVNELCLNHGFEIVYLGLHPWGYHDVALRSREAAAERPRASRRAAKGRTAGAK